MSLIVKFQADQYSQCSGLIGEIISGYAADDTVSKPLYKLLTHGSHNVINWCSHTTYRYLNQLLAGLVTWDVRLKYRNHRHIIRTWVTNVAHMASSTVRLIRHITVDLREFLWDAIAELAACAHRRINSTCTALTEAGWRDEYKAAAVRLIQIITLITEVLPDSLDFNNLSDLAKAMTFELESCLKSTTEEDEKF